MKKPWRVCAACACCFVMVVWPALSQQSSEEKGVRFTLDDGAIVRGDLLQKQIALIFTGGDYGEGTEPVLNTLDKLQIKAGFFVTGGFLSDVGRRHLVERAVSEGHYVGPHSNQHPLYCPWDDREKSLISEADFKKDLGKNIADLKELGALKSEPVYFIPPYEWFNGEQVKWAQEMGVVMFNFSPGSGSNRDYMPESDPRFVSSQKILQDILAYEKKDPHGLNGYILLLHLGADRKDKMFPLLEPLVQELRARGYTFVRIDAMLHAAQQAEEKRAR
jgi:peptidoglycan/xylan/chitin deacetylase (PgdA/CDA1 family)